MKKIIKFVVLVLLVAPFALTTSCQKEGVVKPITDISSEDAPAAPPKEEEKLRRFVCEDNQCACLIGTGTCLRTVVVTPTSAGSRFVLVNNLLDIVRGIIRKR